MGRLRAFAPLMRSAPSGAPPTGLLFEMLRRKGASDGNGGLDGRRGGFHGAYKNTGRKKEALLRPLRVFSRTKGSTANESA